MNGPATVAPVRPDPIGRSPAWPRAFATFACAFLLCGGAAANAQTPSPATPKTAATTPAAKLIPLASPDAAIAARLRGVYANLAGLEAVTVAVNNGVVRLGGTTLTGQERQHAVDIAGRLADVVEVDDRITAETRVSRRVAPEVQRARELGRRMLAFLPLLLVAVLVFAAFLLVGRLLTRFIRPFRRLAPNRFIEELFGQAVRFAFGLAGLVVAMNILGMTALLTSVLGAAGVFGLAIGFAVRDTIENYIASILLSLRQPFAPGDHVLVAGYEGNIALLNSRATVLVTLDGNEVQIPNAMVYKAPLTNFTHLPERRFDFEIAVGPDADLSAALTLAQRTVRGVEGVLAKPEATALADRLDPAGPVIKVFGWVDQRNSDLSKVRGRAMRRTRAALHEAGVPPAVPAMDVRLIQHDKAEADSRTQPSGETDRPDDSDARPDPTIRQKAEAVRASSDVDLLG